MISPLSSRKLAYVACRTLGRLPRIPLASALTSGPDIRTTPTPPRPCALATAAMVSAFGSNTFALGFGGPRYEPLLGDGKHVVHDGIQHKTGREKEEHYAKRDRHDLHHLGLQGIGRLWIQAHLYDHTCPHEYRQDVIRVCRRQVCYPAEKGCVTHLNAGQDGPIQRYKNRNLYQHRQTTT